MRLLIAPNAFKGSLSALEAARSLAAGVRTVFPDAEIDIMPVSDGGDGLNEAMLAARGGRQVRALVKGPLREPRRAEFALLKGRTAVVEMARASGLALLTRSKRDPLGSTSFGTGQLIAAAVKAGARTILVGMGGSATNDGGAGMAQALGARLLDSGGRDLSPGAEALLRLDRIEAAGVRDRLRGVRVIAVSDVTNPLTGPKGSARVYGPQKGASPAQVRVLERALERYARVIERDLGHDVARLPGAGAAGGLGAGLIAFLGAKVVPGSAYVLEAVGAAGRLVKADAALTGEGRLDRTSFYGKAPIEFARLAKSLGVPVAAVVGTLEDSVRSQLRSAGIGAVATLGEAGASGGDAMKRARLWTRKAAALAVKRLLLASLLIGVCPVLRAAPAAELAEIDRLYFHRDQDKNLEESLSKLDALLARAPKDPELLWRRGRSLVRLGERRSSKKGRLKEFEEGEASIKASLALKADDADAHFWLGVAMGRRGQTRGLVRSLFLVGPIRREMRETLRLDPKHGGAHHVLGEILMQLPGLAGGSRKEGIKELEEAVRLSPRYTVNYTTLAEAYSAAGEKRKAIDTLHALFEVKDPDDPAEYPENLKDGREILKKLEP